ncbi:hypothetical protein [Salisaeta longa]|uniref:hypothetical protein n=1 Tax=Salisaeta longa TaxID=503170 RepID=UPI0003B3F68A|nr:hypothetical protein [Salisaeta longa]
MPDSKQPTYRDARQYLRRLIDEQIATRSDAMYMSKHYNVAELGESAAQIFDKTQMNGLERLALSASTFSEIANFIKSQCGRTTSIGDDWREPLPRFGESFGPFLYKRLSEKVISTVDSNTNDVIDALKKGKLLKPLFHPDEKKKDGIKRLEEEISRQLRVGYTRAYISHVVAHYNYAKSFEMSK